MKYIFAQLTAILFISTATIAQTTETFETETTGATTFTDNGQGFTITNGPGETTYDVEFFGNGGWNGSGTDDKFIDNSSGMPTQGNGSSFSITTTDGTDITIKSLYIFIATRALGTPSTTLTITGKKNGSTEYTIVKSSGFSNVTTFSPNNGFTFIDFSSEGGSDNSNTAVDELVISATGNGDYLALDAFTWDAVAVPTWDGSTSTDWNVASNWSTNAVPTSSDDIIIPSAPSNQPVVTSNPGTPAACANLTVESGATLTIDAGKALTVGGDTDNDGTILIKADATGIGSFIDNGTITGSGSFQMQQYLTGSGGATPNGVFYYVSSPIPNATAADYNIASGNKLWVDDEPNQTYPQLTFGAIPLEVGQGYIARMGSTGAITFDGSSYNTGNITEGSLTRTGTTDLNRGYNLVGNPYPSTVNWDDLGRTNLETTMWYRTNNGGTMTFDTYNSTGMVGTNNNGGGTVDGTIPPTQAFWVRVDADGNTGSVAFENADRTHGTLSSIYKAEAEEGTVRLSLSDGTASDEQVIYFDASANDAIDDHDSRKFWTSGIPQLYSNLQEDTLTINGLNSPQTTQTVPLGMKLPLSGNYSLDATSITFTETPAFLEDTYLNVFQDLNAEPNYSFTSDAGNIGDRFILHFNNAAVGIEEADASSHVFAANGQLNVNLSPNTQTANLEIFDMAGRSILTRPINTSNTVVDLNAPTGIYLVRIETAAGAKTHKVVLK